MIDSTSLIWFAAGLIVGFLHASMLWRDVHRFTTWSPLLGMVRMAIVAALLVVAALLGQILAGAAGWAVGLGDAGDMVDGPPPQPPPSAANSRPSK